MSDLTALVTGSNKGIGLEIVRQLAKKGVRVFLSARDLKKGESAVSRLQKEFPRIQFLWMDVANEASIQQAAQKYKEQASHLDVLINNAAILLDKSDSLVKTQPSILMDTFRTNVCGPVLVAQAFLPLLKKSKNARIINVSSQAGSVSHMGTYAPAYSISKAALNAVTCQLAGALKNEGISVNSVCPGWVRTDMGGTSAPRSVEEGASGIVWLATEAPAKTTRQFLQDRKQIEW